jgi:nucleoside-diphosphate-sugar epimerase
VDVPELLDEVKHAPDPRTLYGISKFAAERSCLRLRELWGLDIRVGRLAQAYGRWEYPSGERDTLSLVTQVTAMARDAREAVIPDAGPQDWIYAPDVAAALVALADAPRTADALFHLGTEAPFAVDAWCALLARRYPAFRWRFAQADGTPNVVTLAPRARTAFSARRLREQTGWAPRYGMAEAFADYLAWLDAGGAALVPQTAR